ncbi:MAG: endonuclease [Planctomycetota bacterium]
MANGNGNGGLAEWIVAGVTIATLGLGAVTADDDPAWVLHERLSNVEATNTEDSFDAAKTTLFNRIDNRDDDTIVCVYSGTVVGLVGAAGHLSPDPDAGVQVEHTWASKANWDENTHFPRDSVMGADLHNLFPARQGINGSRGNLPFGELPDTARELRVAPDGSLADPNEGVASGSFRDRNAAGETVFEPRSDHRGNVARAMFYMAVRYWWPIPDDMEADLRRWHREDPVDAAERARNVRVGEAQHNQNPFIDEPDLVDDVTDFE